MGISKKNPKSNFNWQSRILKKKAINCGQLNEPVDCNLFGPTLQITGNNICKPSVSPTAQTVCVFNTQPGQAATTSYEWYEGGPGGPLYYNSYGGASCIEFTVPQQVLGTTTFWIVVTNDLGCKVEQYLDIYVTNVPEFSSVSVSPTDPCVPNVLNPLGQESNGEITITVTNPDPNALEYSYTIARSPYSSTTVDPGTVFSWTDLCYGTYDVTVTVYRLIDGVSTPMCSSSKRVFIGDLILDWDNIANVPVADPNDVSQWNAWFFGGGFNFTSVSVVGSTVYLNGSIGYNFSSFNWANNVNIVAIIDQAGYVNNVENLAFSGCTSLLLLDLLRPSQIGSQACIGNTSLTDVYFRKLGPTIFDNAFDGCVSLNTLYIPEADLSLGTNVFINVIGSTIAVTASSVYQSPLEANLAYLNANNTVTFTWV